jgi:SAM-dependent methyltransferase
MLSGSANNARPRAGFDAACFEPLFAAEDRHFWFVARNKVISSLMAQAVEGLPAGYRVLEVGCGTGNVLKALERTCASGSIVGMDLFAEGLDFARSRVACGLVQGDLAAPPFDRPFEAIGLFDVLEHLPDDEDVLCRLRDLVVPGGALVLTVPAHMSLWSYFDVASGHHRRYVLGDLVSKLRGAGFDVEYASEYLACLFPAMWAGRRLAALFAGRTASPAAERDLALGELRIVPVLNGVLTWVLSQEARLMARRRRLPVGTSIVALARRRR